MKKKQPWFELYPDSDAASRLSIAGGAVKLLSILVLVAAVLYNGTVDAVPGRAGRRTASHDGRLG